MRPAHDRMHPADGCSAGPTPTTRPFTGSPSPTSCEHARRRRAANRGASPPSDVRGAREPVRSALARPLTRRGFAPTGTSSGCSCRRRRGTFTTRYARSRACASTPSSRKGACSTTTRPCCTCCCSCGRRATTRTSSCERKNPQKIRAPRAPRLLTPPTPLLLVRRYGDAHPEQANDGSAAQGGDLCGVCQLSIMSPRQCAVAGCRQAATASRQAFRAPRPPWARSGSLSRCSMTGNAWSA